MRNRPAAALAALLLAAPLSASPGRDAEVAPVSGQAAPVALAPSAVGGAIVLAPAIAAPLANAPASLDAVLLPQAAAGDSPAPRAMLAVGAAGRGFAPRAAASDSVDDGPRAGSEFFDQAPSRPLGEVVAAHVSRPLNGAFIQQEHEGYLRPDPRDSTGNVFRYYRPVEMRRELADDVERGLSGFSKFAYKLRRAFQIRGRSATDAAWRAWPLEAKLDYLRRLETDVEAERGPEAAWDWKASLLLTRKENAPDFVATNPHMESRWDDEGDRYRKPEIVSAKDKPAVSVAEALERARRVISDTGHAGIHFHVFIKEKPETLLAQLDSMDGALQLVNDALFASAVLHAGGEGNISASFLQPWHRGRYERVRELLTARRPGPHVSEGLDNEKFSPVGFRYWGMEGDRAVVSLELRGASLPLKMAAERGASVGSGNMPKRDYDQARSYLTFLALYAEALSRGRAPRVSGRSAVIDHDAAETALSAAARDLGMPPSAYDGMDAFSRRVLGKEPAPQAYFFPFAALPADSPERKAFAREAVLLAAEAKAQDESGRVDQKSLRQRYWAAYKLWLKPYGERRSAELSRLGAELSRSK